MNRQFYIPVKLYGLVDNIWEHEFHEAKRWTILPTGKIELIFRIGASPDVFSAKKISNKDNPMKNFCFVSGLHTKPITMDISDARGRFIGLRMYPIAFKAFFGIPLAEIRDYYLPGSEVINTLHVIEERLNSEIPFTVKAQWLENLLYTRVTETPELHFAISLNTAIQKLIQQNSIHPNRLVEEMLGYSRTHSFRLFNDWFGLSPHGYQKLQHFVKAVRIMHLVSEESLTTTGLDLGYYDQSHFIRSFKSFANIPPGEYRKRMDEIPGYFSG